MDRDLLQLAARAALTGAAAALAGLATFGALAVGAALALSVLNTVRPPQPMRFGKVAMAYECGFAVDGVERRERIAGRRAQGEFYVVRGRIVCPFGERYRWSPDAVFVASNGIGARTAPDEIATRALDARAATPHAVLGAAERVTVAFDLPRDAVQPALVFAESVAPGAILAAWLDLKIYHPRRFNLRLD